MINKLDLKGGGPCTATRPESMEGVVVGNGGGEEAIENHRHCLPNQLHEAYTAVPNPPFQDQHHRLPGGLLCY